VGNLKEHFSIIDRGSGHVHHRFVYTTYADAEFEEKKENFKFNFQQITHREKLWT
jgi:hypothetical protein